MVDTLQLPRVSGSGRGRYRALERVALALLLAWGVAPLVVMVVHALSAHLRLTGADGTIAADQLQYLSWVRDASAHGLAGDLFTLPPSARVFLHPLFTLSGVLTWAGLPAAAAYLLWKPIVVVVLFAGAAAWAGRFFEADAAGRAAVVVLSLFLFSPVATVFGWGGVGSASAQANVVQAAGEMFPAGMLWGYPSSAMAVGLMPFALTAPRPVVAAVAAALAAWLHPWAGVILIVVLLGLAAWEHSRSWPTLVLPAVAAALPLAYYGLLSKLDTAWQQAGKSELVPRLPLWALVLALVPMGVIAGWGVRPPRNERRERALLLWIAASVAAFLVIPAFPSHALEGLSLPLAVLAVRAWRRVPLHRAPELAAVVIAAVLLPGLIYAGRSLLLAVRNGSSLYYIRKPDAQALDWIARAAPPGGVLAREPLAIAVPSQTEHAVWVGHQFWSRDYIARARAVQALFSGALPASNAQQLVALSGARLLWSDCAAPADPGPALGALVGARHSFGCSRVYVIRSRPGPSAAAGAPAPAQRQLRPAR